MALLLSLPAFPKMKPQAVRACNGHLKASGSVLFSRVVFICCGLCVVHPHLCGFDGSTRKFKVWAGTLSGTQRVVAESPQL